MSSNEPLEPRIDSAISKESITDTSEPITVAPTQPKVEDIAPPKNPVAPEATIDNEFTSSVNPQTIAAIAGGYHSTPFDILGIHPLSMAGQPNIVVRTFQPQGLAVSVKRDHILYPMKRIHPDGLFEAICPGETEFFRYRLFITLPGTADFPGRSYEIEDPYRYPPVLTDYDLHLFGEGNHFRLYQKLGAHVIQHEGASGVSFAVWAPNAERVSVIGDFNQWDGRRNPMRPRGASGLWEIFIPGLQQGDLYRYEIKTRYHGYVAVKSDPFGFVSELRPKTASVVWDLNRYEWHDREWMAARKHRQSLDAPIAIYEVHLGSWKRKPDPEYGYRWLNYRELAEDLVPYVKDMGFTHIELLPITEHPYDSSAERSAIVIGVRYRNSTAEQTPWRQNG